jgi:hypothetical protein
VPNIQRKKIRLKECYPAFEVFITLGSFYTPPAGANGKATCRSYKKSYLSELPIRSKLSNYLRNYLPGLYEELPDGAA